MKKTISKIYSIGLVMLTGSALSMPAYAGQGDSRKTSVKVQQQQQQASRSRIHQISPKERRALRQVSGQVLNTKTVEVRGTDAKNLVAMIKTNKADQRLVVDLGPRSAYNKQAVKSGTQLSVQGPVKDIRGRQFLVAQKVKIGDKVMEIDRSVQAQQHNNSEAIVPQVPVEG